MCRGGEREREKFRKEHAFAKEILLKKERLRMDRGWRSLYGALHEGLANTAHACVCSKTSFFSMNSRPSGGLENVTILPNF